MHHVMVSHMMQVLKKYNAFALKTCFEYKIGLVFKLLKTDKVTQSTQTLQTRLIGLKKESY